jgi:organic radical activating enzyme
VRRLPKPLREMIDVWRHLAAELPCPPAFEGATPTLRRIANLYRVRLEWYRLKTVLRSSPAKLCIEATSACNLACPHCFTGAGEVGRPGATLSLAFYRQLLAELGDRLWQIEFHNWGEPLLNKQLVTMIAEATARGISTVFCTNFSVPFDAAHAEALVGAGLKLLGVSIDGSRQEIYEQYRVHGKLDLVLRNCRLMNEAKRRLGSSTPRMNWSYHIFPHNVDDVEAAEALASELGMHFHASRGRVFGADWDPEAKRVPHDQVAALPCFTLWHTAVMYADGSVAPCRGSFYPADDLGRMAADGRPGAASFRAVWNGERFRLARRFFGPREGMPAEQSHICFSCPYVIDWHGYAGHVIAGNSPDTWKPAFNSNERYNYFLSRRPTDVTKRVAVAGSR